MILKGRHLAFLYKKKEQYLISLNYGLITILLISMSFCIYNIKGLSVGRDEGIHAFAAKTLGFEGTYALKNGTTFLTFDRRIAVGPTVIAPAALVFRIFGFSLSSIRVVPAVYFLLFILFFYLLIRKIYGGKVAFLSCFFVLSAQWASMGDLALFNPIYRTLTGESAALFFLVLGLYIWSFDSGKRIKLLAYFILGLSLVTKYQFALISIPLLISSLFSENTASKDRSFLKRFFVEVLYLFVFFMPLILWFCYQYLYLGHIDFLNEFSSYKNFSNQTFDLSFFRIKQNIIDKWVELNPIVLKIFFTLPALIFGWLSLIHEKVYKDKIKLFLILFPTIWMFWYLFSRGYIRYEVPGLYFSLIFLSLFFISPLKDVYYKKRSPANLFLCSMVVLMLSFGFYIDFRESKIVEPQYSEDMAIYISENIPAFARIITSELDYDVDIFLRDRVLYHTPSGSRSAAVMDVYQEIPVNMGYILSKENDPTFEHILKDPMWELDYESGDWLLFRNTSL